MLEECQSFFIFIVYGYTVPNGWRVHARRICEEKDWGFIPPAQRMVNAAIKDAGPFTSVIFQVAEIQSTHWPCGKPSFPAALNSGIIGTAKISALNKSATKTIATQFRRLGRYRSRSYKNSGR